MPLSAGSMLRANGPQSPNGTAVNASAILGLTGAGGDLEDQLKQQQQERQKKLLSGIADPGSMGLGGSTLLGAAGQLFGLTR